MLCSFPVVKKCRDAGAVWLYFFTVDDIISDITEDIERVS